DQTYAPLPVGLSRQKVHVSPGFQTGTATGITATAGDDAGLSSAGAPVPALSGKRARRFAISSAGGRWPGASAPPHRMAAWAPRRWVTIVRTASVWLMPRTRIRISTA